MTRTEQVVNDSALVEAKVLPTQDGQALLRAEGVSKRFRGTQALKGARIAVKAGELVGIAGHNGAGKSTLLRIVCGLIRPDEGHIQIAGTVFEHGLSVRESQALGIRAVHQELSLCAGLRVDESAAVAERAAGGLGWRRRAWQHLEALLDEIFPGHGIMPGRHIGELSIARRQMVEIATAALPGRYPARLLVLDEPTSSLDRQATEGLYRWLRNQATEGLSAVVTTHRLNEMLSYVDRIYVMRDGEVKAEQNAKEVTRDHLVALMAAAEANSLVAHTLSAEEDIASTAQTEAQLLREVDKPIKVAVTGLSRGSLHDVSVEVRAGELVGIAGLEGHGQRPLLEWVFRAAMRPRFMPRDRSVSVRGRVAYVSGDRAVAGIFQYWDVAGNISVSSLGAITRLGLLLRQAELRLAALWCHRLEIRGYGNTPILSLSGGNQQKVLVARAMATGADVILLDDPTRGVDQETKEQLYTMLRDRADNGGCFLWYSTENEELVRCDRIYVLRAGRVVETLTAADRDSARIVAASFRAPESEA